MTTITLATLEDWRILLDKYCTCVSSDDLIPDRHKVECGYRKLNDEWGQEANENESR